MNLTYQRGQFVHMTALETYILAVENNLIPCLPTHQRLRFVETMISVVTLHMSDKPGSKKKASEEYKRKVSDFFAQESVVIKLYKKFEIAEAEADGRLSPERIVNELLVNKQANYGQKSELQTYALNAIQKAKTKGHDLSKIINSTRQAVRRTSVYRDISKSKETVNQ